MPRKSPKKTGGEMTQFPKLKLPEGLPEVPEVREYDHRLSKKTVKNIAENLQKVPEETVKRVLKDAALLFKYFSNSDMVLFDRFANEAGKNNMDINDFFLIMAGITSESIEVKKEAPTDFILKFMLFCRITGLNEDEFPGPTIYKIGVRKKQNMNTEEWDKAAAFWPIFIANFEGLNSMQYYFGERPPEEGQAGGKRDPLDKLNKSDLVDRLKSECAMHPKKVCDRLGKSMKKKELLELCKSLKC